MEGSFTAAQCDIRRETEHRYNRIFSALWERLEALMQTPYSGTTTGGTLQGPTSAVARSNKACPTHLTRMTGKHRRRRRQHRVAKNPETPMPHRQRLPHHACKNPRAALPT
ncbi:Hypothetical predicted protein [Pelobates cultripes]|uniref:Uncharacterized protein n=1 Tax=Pelobates cultripes TaxID=61616 RepID=A0AAD1R368_PELCU|nr:Hypothetical predicted protein [Pelobates cultripes]